MSVHGSTANCRILSHTQCKVPAYILGSVYVGQGSLKR